jgi:hypothetical protein
MKCKFPIILLALIQLALGAWGQAPAQTANTYVRPYTETFQYGANLGYYSTGWPDEKLAGLVQKLGGHTLRLSLPETFVERYGYSIRANAFRDYVGTYGMKELTCFVGAPSEAHRDTTTYPGATGQSKLFAHLYEPVWNANGSVNPNNYYAFYLYKLLQVYGDKVRIWEIVNEPDYSPLSGKDAWLTRAPAAAELTNLRAPVYHYIRMLRISYEVIKRYRPDAYVTPGGLGYSQFLDALLRYTDNPNGGTVTAQYPLKGGAYIDMLSYHSYPAYGLHAWDTKAGVMRYTRTSDYAASRVMTEKQAMVDVLSRYGYTGASTAYPLKPVILTETNVSRRTALDLTGSDEMQRNFGIKVQVLAQQQGIAQLHFYSLGEQINAPAPAQVVSSGEAFQLMGLYENLKRDQPGAEKRTPLGQAFATTTKLLYGARYDAARTRELALPATVEGAAFRKGSSFVYVLWAKSLTDNSEAAAATYSFPTAWNLSSVQRYEWDYDATGMQRQQPARDIALTGSPAFFDGAAATGCTGAGTLLREQWNNLAGTALSSIPVDTPPSSSTLLPQFEANASTEVTYGARLRGYLCPPQTGTYTFWLAGDDAAELFLSPDGDPAHKVSFATCAKWTASAHDWFRYPSQQSVSVQLQSGQLYYVEVLHKQAWGPGYVAVGWQLPDGRQQLPVPGSALLPMEVAASGTSARGSTALARTGPATALPGTNLSIYPNPVTRQATVQVQVSHSGPTTVALYNLNGQLVQTLFSGMLPANAPHTLPFDATGLTNGLYLLRLITDHEVVTQKVVCPAL